VLFRHRRRPPVLAFAVVGAVFVGAIALSLRHPFAIAALLAAALGLVALGVAVRRRYWLEDQLLTRTAAVVVRQDGTTAEVPYARIDRIVRRSSGIAFVRDDGRRLLFDRNPHLKRMRAVLAERLPDAQWVDDVELACDT
jgi:ribosomal protein L24E